jgi:hypothetical protein
MQNGTGIYTVQKAFFNCKNVKKTGVQPQAAEGFDASLVAFSEGKV